MTIQAKIENGDVLEFPDGTSPEVIQSTVKKHLATRQQGDKPAFERDAEKTLSYTTPELIAGSAPVRFAAGAGSNFLGFAQGMERAPVSPASPLFMPVSIARAVAKYTGLSADETLREFEKLKRRGMEAYRQEGIDVVGAAGAAAGPGTAMAVKALPTAAATYGGRVGQGAGAGAVFGATSPVTEDGNFAVEKGLQTGGGAVVGGAVPGLVAPAVKAGFHSLVEPWLAPAAIKGRAYLAAAGDKAGEIAERLRANLQIVPGSRPTAGQLAAPEGVAEFSALQAEASKANPTPYLARADEQNAARLTAIRKVGQDKEALQSAEGTRAATGKANYEKALSTTAIEEPAKRDSALSISQFVAQEGGLKKSLVGGDLNTDYSDLPMGLLQGTKFPKGLALRKVQHEGPTAKSPDHMRERLVEEGYLSPSNSIDDMYTMLSDELAAGHKLIMSVNDIDATLAARAASRVPRNETLVELEKRPAFMDAVKQANELAKEEGLNIGDPRNSMLGLHHIKLALDDLISTAQTNSSMGRTQLRAIEGTKEKLLGMMDTLSPAYKYARETYKAQSAPINQMKVGQYLEGKLVPAVSDEAKQSAASYSQALRDAPGTIKRSTGKSRFDDLAQALTPQQQRIVYSIRDDLANVVRDQEMARLGSQAAGDITGGIASSHMERLPNLLMRPAMVANFIMSKLAGRVDKKLIAEMATEMLDPPKVGEAVSQAITREAKNRMIANELSKLNIMGTAAVMQPSGSPKGIKVLPMPQ